MRKALFMLLATPLLFSCKKDATPENPMLTYSAKSYTDYIYNPGSGTKYIRRTLITYDEIGQIIRLWDSTYRYEFAYQADKSFTTEYYAGSKLMSRRIDYLGPNGTDSAILFAIPGIDPNSRRVIYQYDNSHFLKSLQFSFADNPGSQPYAINNYFYDQDGNLAKYTTASDSTTYTYYLDKINPSFIFPHELRTRNVVKTSTYQSINGTFTENHSYTFDSGGRIVADTTRTDLSGAYVLRTFEY